MNSRKIIVEILDNVIKKGAYSNIEINKRFKNSNINDKDRGLITEVVYGTLKNKKTIDIILGSFVSDVKDIDEKVVNILRSAIYQIKYLDRIPSYAVVNESVNLAKIRAKSLSSFVNGVLRNYLRNLDKDYKKGLTDMESLEYYFSFNSWMIKLLLKQYGKENGIKILKGLNETPYITVRTNILKTTREELLNFLLVEGYDVEKGYISDSAIMIKKGSSIEKNSLYTKGMFTVQDESAMLVSECLNLRYNDTVLDICSAPGTKGTHVSEILNNTGKVLAFDIHTHKLKLIEDNAKRLGIFNIEVKLGDASKFNRQYLNSADKILLDVPCSGLGIIRKKPEIKWTKTLKDLKDIEKTQRVILENAWRYLKRGGEMIYSTCTLNKDENEEIINWFLRKHEDCEVEKINLCKKDNILYNTNGTVTILPHKYRDGFFIARLRKK